MYKESCYDYFTHVYEAVNHNNLPGGDFIVTKAVATMLKYGSIIVHRKCKNIS